MTSHSIRPRSALHWVSMAVVIAIGCSPANAMADGMGPWDPVAMLPPAGEVKSAPAAVTIPMRDGVELAASLWLPDGAGPFPVVISRTAYSQMNYAGSAEAMLERGVAYLSVDVRGRFDSGGDWEPLLGEDVDGQDVIAWADAQPWCNGRIGTFGGSYDAWIQMLAATRGAPELDAMAAIVLPADPWENAPFDNGALSPPFLTWLIPNRGRVPEPWPDGVDFLEVVSSYPIRDWDNRVGTPTPFFNSWVNHWQMDAYWENRSYESRLGNVSSPVIFQTGWFDLNHPGTIRAFSALINHPNRRVRLGTKLVIGPWHHGLGYLPAWGELEFPENARIDSAARWFGWLSNQLQGSGLRSGPPVEYYLMGRNVWLAGDDWPPNNSREVAFYLAPGGQLLTESPSEASDVFVYDPTDPTPVVEPLTSQTPGMAGHYPHDLAALSQRTDTLLYATDVLAAPFALVGPIAATIHLSSSAPDTDIGAQLVDITPDGRLIAIQNGLSRARFRDGYVDPKPLQPGEIAAIDVDLWSSAYEFAEGHRIGVLVSSAQFPCMDAHRNLYDDLARGTESALATQTVHLGGLHASRLVVHRLVESTRRGLSTRLEPEAP